MHNFPALWAVHLGDGILPWPWLAGGFAVAGLLAFVACRRLREEDVPRIALLSAAFFVASSIHVKIGPTSVHLLFAGLVGVLLTWRAPVAILLGVTLQQFIIGHGGFSTIGVNTCTQAIPALVVGGMFALLRQSRWLNNPLGRASLVGVISALWAWCVVFGVVVLWTNPLRDLVRYSARAGLVISGEGLSEALLISVHPMSLFGIAFLGFLGAWYEKQLASGPAFGLGVLAGMVGVVLTTLTAGAILLFGDAEQWGVIVSVLFLAHLPLALLEGLIVGCVTAFLDRVRPDMLPGGRNFFPPLSVSERGPGGEVSSSKQTHVELQPGPPPNPLSDTERGEQDARPCGSGYIPLALLAFFFTASPAFAHRLDAEHKVNRDAKEVIIEAWYETGDAPENANVRVTRTDGSLLTEGTLDKKGVFRFRYDKAESLDVRITSSGHSARVRIKAAELLDDAEPGSAKGAATDRSLQLLVGLTFLLALASFIMGVLNARKLQRMAARIDHFPSGNTSSSATSH